MVYFLILCIDVFLHFFDLMARNIDFAILNDF